MAWSPWLRETWQSQFERNRADSLEDILFEFEGVDLEANYDPRNLTLDDVPDPFSFRQMQDAVEYTLKVIANSGEIVIYGDYDADGLTASALLARFFSRHGIKHRIVIPDRIDDGYGLSMDLVTSLVKGPKPDLVITVDCGISALAEVSYLAEHDVPCIITDHHKCPSQLPPALAIINPQCDLETYPFRELAGVAVAFNFIWALATAMEVDEFESDTYLSLVAIGTVADAMPLNGVNRILVREGLRNFLESAPIGLVKLAKDLSKGSKPDSRFLGFSLAPRLNAAGRLSKIQPALDLLLTNDPLEAARLAKELNNLNFERREIEGQILTEAEALLASDPKLSLAAIVLLYSDTWHPGVIGIVANRLMEKLQKPVIILAPAGADRFRASARSPEGVNLIRILSQHSDRLEAFGGHSCAAGFTIEREQIEPLQAALAEAELEYESQDHKHYLCELRHSEVLAKNIELIESFGPYGQDHPEPLLELRKVTLSQPREIGDGRHFACNLELSDQTYIRAVAFVRSEFLKLAGDGDLVNVRGHLSFNYFRGKCSLQFQIVDLELVCEQSMGDDFYQAELAYQSGLDSQSIASKFQRERDEFRVKADQIKALYIFISREFNLAKPVDLSRLTLAFNHTMGQNASPFVVRRILDLFENQDLVHSEKLAEGRYLLGLLPEPAQRVKLSSTKTWDSLLRGGFIWE